MRRVERASARPQRSPRRPDSHPCATQELEAAAKGEVPLFEQDLQWLNAVRALCRPFGVASLAGAGFPASSPRAPLPVPLASLTHPPAQPLGTQANPVQVASTLTSRIVGATDVDDDSIIHWGLVEEGKPPVKIGEEYFVLKRSATIPESHLH